jgi:hypothetical protein
MMASLSIFSPEIHHSFHRQHQFPFAGVAAIFPTAGVAAIPMSLRWQTHCRRRVYVIMSQSINSPSTTIIH